MRRRRWQSNYSLNRSITSAAQPDLKTTLRDVIPEKRELLKQIRAKPDTKIGSLTAGHVIYGMRAVKAMVWEGSVLDPYEGIRFHGRTIADCQEQLPKGTSGTEMIPEAMFWLLLTGQVPSVEQIRSFSRELAEKSQLPSVVTAMLKNFEGSSVHPMTQLASAVAVLNVDSAFARAYAQGLNKADYWEPTLDDAISLLAKLPRIAALIMSPSTAQADMDPNRDWSHNMATLLGKGSDSPPDTGFQDLLRLYLALHGDHEGGNVSSHATHLVGSALSDPFLSYSAGLLGLAGPLHGLAAQEVLRWLLKMQSHIQPSDGSSNITDESVKDYIWSTLKSGQVIPGYGHGVLRRPDPRFTALVKFGDAHPDISGRDDSGSRGGNSIYHLMKQVSQIAPTVLAEHGKAKNPHPNVDSASGTLFHDYGLTDPTYYTVIFGVSRGMGPMAQLVWDRVLGLSLERPKSVTLERLSAMVKRSADRSSEGKHQASNRKEATKRGFRKVVGND